MYSQKTSNSDTGGIIVNRDGNNRYDTMSGTRDMRRTQSDTSMGKTYTQTTSVKRKKKLRFKPTKDGMIALGELFLIVLAVFLVIFLVIKGIVGSKKPAQTTDPDNITTTNPAQTTTDAPKPSWNAGYISLGVASSGKGEGNLILVNNDHEYTFPSKMTTKLTELYGKTEGLFVLGAYEDSTRRGVYLNSGILPSLRKMCEAMIAANKESFVEYKNSKGETLIDKIMISSGFRSKDYQQDLYDDADDTSLLAKAGHSEHHTGLAFDVKLFTIGPKSTATRDLTPEQYEWITENCHKYGFIRRYQAEKLDKTGISNEEWHFRFVDIPHAYAMKDADLCLEEYIDMLKTKHDSTKGTPCEVSTDIGDFLIYYVPADTADITYITVPQGAKLISGSFAAEQNITSGMYTVSGTNEGGFVVTIAK